MLLGFHFIFSAYGFWLPNDTRGSWSTTIRQFDLLRFGPATKVETTRSVAWHSHNHALRAAAKQALRYPPVIFNGKQTRAIARGFAAAAGEHGYICTPSPSCQTMPTWSWRGTLDTSKRSPPT